MKLPIRLTILGAILASTSLASAATITIVSEKHAILYSIIDSQSN